MIRWTKKRKRKELPKNRAGQYHKKAAGKTSPPVEVLSELLASMDFDRARKAAESLGETTASEAVKPLVEIARRCSSLRATAMTALKKLGRENDKAAAELAMVVMDKEPESPGGEWGVRVLSKEDRRRSPRVLLEIPALATWTDTGGTTHTEPTKTQVVNAYGALLNLSQPLPNRTELELTNVKTRAMATARVVWSGTTEAAGVFEVAVELNTMDEQFWVGRTLA